MKIYVPLDSAAKALGADEIADAIVAEAGARGMTVEVIRYGTLGMIWLEPLIEVETENGRVGYGAMDQADVPALLDGTLKDLDWMKGQTRLTFQR
jgi:formate dehydrogenase iron-sulfur subunit